jgi:hypothetical protein
VNESFEHPAPRSNAVAFTGSPQRPIELELIHQKTDALSCDPLIIWKCPGCYVEPRDE